MKFYAESLHCPHPDPSGNIPWDSAYSLALASKLAYADRPVCETVVKSTWKMDTCEWFEGGGITGFVASDAQAVVVSFRGSATIQNWLGNAKFLASEYFGWQIHTGFREAFEQLEGALWKLLQSAGAESKLLWYTGHSLGGALACLAAARYTGAFQGVGVYTYGQPCTGLSDFAAYFSSQFPGFRGCYRFVNENDIVTRLAPGYAHVGNLVHFDADGDVVLSQSRSQPACDVLTESEVETRRAEIELTLEADRNYWTAGETIFDVQRELELHRGAGISAHAMYAYLIRIEKHLRTTERSEVSESVDAVAPRNPTSPASHSAQRGEAPQALPASDSQSHPVNLPPFCVHIVGEDDGWGRDEGARELAEALFGLLNFRPSGHAAVESGPRIPTFVGKSLGSVRDLLRRVSQDKSAEAPCLAVILLLDGTAAANATFREEVQAFLAEHTPESIWPNGIIIPIPFTYAWSNAVLGKNFTGIRPNRQAENRSDAESIAWMVGVEIAQFLLDRKKHPLEPSARNSRQKIKIFISYARTDLPHTGRLAEKLNTFFYEARFDCFFDVQNVSGSRTLDHQMAEGQADSVLLSIRTDSYGESPYCLAEVLRAKQLGLPVITVNALTRLESRSPSFTGNTVTVACHLPKEGDFTDDAHNLSEVAFTQLYLQKVANLCLSGWLHHLHFHYLAPAVARRRGIDLGQRDGDIRVLSRPPELLDISQGWTPSDAGALVIYPDPPLPEVEANLLRRANPSVSLATPTTLAPDYRRRDPSPSLHGKRIALSLSESPDLAKNFLALHTHPGTPRDGVFKAHLDAAAGYLSLSLIRGGAELGYGGHLGEQGYTALLQNLIRSHNRLRGNEDGLLYNYIASYLYDRKTKGVADGAEVVKISLVEGQKTAEGPPFALELSLMRHAMAHDTLAKRLVKRKACDARVIMGGRTTPKPVDPQGYSGRFPGQAEEAYHTLKAEKPLYVAGGFGGVAGQVALALQGHVKDRLAESANLETDPEFAALCRAYAEAPKWEGFAGPTTLDDLWNFLSDAGRGYFHGPEASPDAVWTNGLTVAENRKLFDSRDADEISTLVLQGLNAKFGAQDGKRAGLALYQGSITEILEVESYGVMVLRNSPLQGADGALDDRLGGALSRQIQSGSAQPYKAFKVESRLLAGDWVLLYPIDLSKLDPQKFGVDAQRKWLLGEVGKAVNNLVEKAEKRGVVSLALVPFGANLGLSPAESVQAIVETLAEVETCGILKTVVICEQATDRFTAIRDHLRAKGVSFTELASTAAPSPPSRPRLTLTLRDRNNLLECTASPGGLTATGVYQHPVDWKSLEKEFHSQSSPPSFETHNHIAKNFTRTLFSGEVLAVLREHHESSWDILHDQLPGSVPLEMICVEDAENQAIWPALSGGGVHRSLMVQGLPPVRKYIRSGVKLQMLVVADPTGDLPGAREEALQIEALVNQRRGDLSLTTLIGPQVATRAAVLDLIQHQTFDLLHYAGHGQLIETDLTQSGLVFPDGIWNAAEITKLDLENPPALVVLNACQVGKVGTEPKALPALPHELRIGLAEAILRAGVGGFLSNQWNVGDASAKLFAQTLYENLFSGQSLGEATRAARKKLFEAQNRDWPNYVFYGAPGLRI